VACGTEIIVHALCDLVQLVIGELVPTLEPELRS
jgi:hypothetical protein